MITEIKTGNYDPESMHQRYDSLLKDFILNYDESLLSLMKKLIELDKTLWYG
jgi:hypothetical protein